MHRLLAARLADIDRQIADLQVLRATVAQLCDEARLADPAACDAEDFCSYM